MDQQIVLGRGLELIVYVLRIERAEPYLTQHYLSQGMPEANVQGYIAARCNGIRLSLLIAALVITTVGYATSQLLRQSVFGQIGGWTMYLGLLLAALQLKRYGEVSSGPLTSMLSMFRKK